MAKTLYIDHNYIILLISKATINNKISVKN